MEIIVGKDLHRVSGNDVTVMREGIRESLIPRTISSETNMFTASMLALATCATQVRGFGERGDIYIYVCYCVVLVLVETLV